MRTPFYEVATKLTIWVDRTIIGDDTDNLFKIYAKAAEKHNHMVKTSKFPDAGFDVFTPVGGVEKAGYVVNGKHTQVKLKTGVRCSMERIRHEYGQPVEIWSESFYMFPRSSISKTQFRLANNVGIIDSGYRGQLMAVLDILPGDESNDISDITEQIQPYSRFVQICCGNLYPFLVEVKIADEDEVNRIIANTKRGEGGFGSTGR